MAAVLDVGGGNLGDLLPDPGINSIFETPAGLQLTSSFAALKLLPNAQFRPAGPLQVITDIHGIELSASSPLVNGQAMRLAAHQVLVVLWTN